MEEENDDLDEALVAAAQRIEEAEQNNMANDKDGGKKGSLYDKYFEYQVIDKVKHGCCRLCGKSKSGSFLKVLKMTGSNTSGLKGHLENKHKNEYKELLTQKGAGKSAVGALKIQKKPLNKFFSDVSLFPKNQKPFLNHISFSQFFSIQSKKVLFQKKDSIVISESYIKPSKNNQMINNKSKNNCCHRYNYKHRMT